MASAVRQLCVIARYEVSEQSLLEPPAMGSLLLRLSLAKAPQSVRL